MIECRGRCETAVAGESTSATACEGCDVSALHHADALIAGVRYVEGSVRRHDYGHGRVQLCGCGGADIAREALRAVAGDHRDRATDRYLEDLVARGIGDEEIAGCVVSDPGRSHEG